MIRAATLNDAPAIARVHVESWRTTYRGFLADDFLLSLSETGYADRWLGGFQCGGVGASILLEELRRCSGPIKPVRIRLMPARLDFCELFLALKKLVDWIKR